MNTLPNVLLPQPAVSTAKNANSVPTATTATEDFSSLLHQTLPDSFKSAENQLKPSLPGQVQSEQTLLQSGPLPPTQLTALSQQVLSKLADIYGDHLQTNNLDLKSFNTLDSGDLDLSSLDLSALNANTLSQLAAQISQMLADQSAEPGQNRLTDKTASDNLTAGELAAMDVLLAMLPMQAASTTHSPSTGVSSVLNHSAVITADRQQVTTAVTGQNAIASQWPELASAVSPVIQATSTELNNSAHHNTDNPPGGSGSKAQTNDKQQLQLNADSNKQADNFPHRHNTVLPVISVQQSTDFATASRQAAELAISAAGTHSVSQPVTSASTVNSSLIQAPLGSPQWQQLVGQQIALFSHQGHYRAELRLHPAELGNVKISIKLDDNNLAQLQLLSPHSHVRAALEAALPTLRTQLAESGIQLGQSHIGSESFAGQQFTEQQFHGQPQSAPYDSFSNLPVVTESLVTPDSLAAMARGDGAVDTFV